MEKKTIGSFIAILRKAKGMTQRDLAELLNISDKSISRWERDETAPDISLLPVIAEIFSITTDELLSGERKIRTDNGNDNTISKKAQQNLQQHIAHKSMSRYKSLSIISIGVSAIGFIAAMLCNFSFLRANLGFYISLMFSIAALIFQCVITVNTNFSLSCDSIENEYLNSLKSKINSILSAVIIITAIIFSATLPLITLVNDAYCGIHVYDFFPTSATYAILTSIISAVILIIMHKNQLDKRLALKCLIAALVLPIITYVVMYGISHSLVISSPHHVYDNIEEFIAFAETHSPNSTDGTRAPHQDFNYETIEFKGVDHQYNWLNNSMAFVEVKNNKIIVFTYEQFDIAKNKGEILIPIFLIMVILETFIPIFIYFRRRQKA